jgi:hypothetical protein
MTGIYVQPPWLVLAIFLSYGVMMYFNLLKFIAFFAGILSSALASLLAAATFLLLA